MELEWWVSVGWFTVINIMMLCECVCVFLCLGDYRRLGVWCVWLGDCFWVSLCVCLSVYVFVIMCVRIYPVSTCVSDKCVIPYCLRKTSLCALCARVGMFLCDPDVRGHTSFSSFTVRLCLCTGASGAFYDSTARKISSPTIDMHLRGENVCGIWRSSYTNWCADVVFFCARGLCVCVLRRSGEWRSQRGGQWSTVWGSRAEGLWD